MTTKEQLLALLDQNRGKFISGEEIASMLNVSRGAVWKAIKSLQTEGYQIDAVTNKGYCLAENTDLLSEPVLRKYLSERASNLHVEVYKQLSSTNDAVKERVPQGFSDERVILAEYQTRGRGRKNRDFFSPEGTGIYFSLLLHPKISVSDSTLITTAAAVAVAQVIEKFSGELAQIKWVNDVFLRGRKVAGILTEAGISLETGGLDYVIVGIGINIYEPEGGFPESLAHVATAIFDHREEKRNVRNYLAAEVINQFIDYCDRLPNRAFLEDYRKRSLVIGKDIMVLGKEDRKARALDIDDACHLKVRYENGEEETLYGGDISIGL